MRAFYESFKTLSICSLCFTRTRLENIWRCTQRYYVKHLCINPTPRCLPFVGSRLRSRPACPSFSERLEACELHFPDSPASWLPLKFYPRDTRAGDCKVGGGRSPFFSTSAEGWGGGRSGSWGKWVCAQVVGFQQQGGGGASCSSEFLNSGSGAVTGNLGWEFSPPPASWKTFQQEQWSSGYTSSLSNRTVVDSGSRHLFLYSVRLRTVVASCCY